MRILQINSVFAHGSTGKIAKGIHDYSLKEGYQITSIYGRKKLSISDSLIVYFGSNFFMFFHMVFTTFGYHGRGSKHLTKKVLKPFLNNPPDLVQLHNLHGYYIHYPYLFETLKKWNVPVIWTLHDTWSFTGHCAHYTNAKCDKWKTGCNNCPQKNQYPFSFIKDNSKESYLYKQKLFNEINHLTLVTPSRWLSHEVQQSFLKKLTSTIINNGIDLSIFKPKLHSKYEKFTILGIARPFTKKKGFKVFLELSTLLNENEQIILVGLSRHQMLNLPKNIMGIQSTNNIQEIVSLYSNADVFVNPSFEENFPTTHLESMACGTPVVCFNTGGSAEMLTPDTGIVCDLQTVSSVYEAIQKVKEKGKKFYSKACVQQATKFSEKDTYLKYINLYKSILQK